MLVRRSKWLVSSLMFHYSSRRPEPGEIRNIVLEKDSEPLGIQIRCLQTGGVFVSAVTVNSLAEQVLKGGRIR